jgi:AraC-like DNA-binding protein
MMVKTGHSAPIRRVRFRPPSPAVGDLEVNTVMGIRERGGPLEFLTPQRLDFDLLVRVESGATEHTVDFTEYSLGPTDVLWVRAGQVHQWGGIGNIEGAVVMFGPHTVDADTRDLLRSSRLVHPRSHWPAASLEGSPVHQVLDLLVVIAQARATERHELRQAALAHALATALLQLTLVEPIGRAPTTGATHEAFGWFRDHIEEHFHQWHKVGEYADRLGYSARTLNRLARRHTGLSAKEMIDERVLLEAKRLLAHGDASVAGIAEQLGFDDASNFSSWFRRQNQTTPGTFRTQSRTAKQTPPRR